MHCDCCDTLLTSEETRIRLRSTNEFANTCRVCLDSAGLSYKLPRPSYEQDIIKDNPEELEEGTSDNPYSEDYWNER